MTRAELDALIQRQQEIMNDCEAKLRSRDYIGTKIATGVATRTEYEDAIAEMQEWRAEWNAAHDEYERLQSVEPDEEEYIEPMEEEE